MKQKVLMWCFVVVFFAASLTLSLGILLAGPSEAGANERLSRTPVLIAADGKWNPDILGDAAAWINDHFFLRQELISLDNLLTAKLLRTSGAEDVILGEDGWLYYKPTLDNYVGQNLLTDREIFSAATNLRLMAEYCREQGQEFVFVIAPNKNSLYPEQMPNFGAAAPRQDAQALFGALTGQQVPYVDLFSLFDAQSEPLYFAHDSHWNSKGAALGADAINEAFGQASSYFSDTFASSTSHKGDLYEMLYPALRDPEKDPVYGGTLQFTYTGSATKPDSILLQTQGGGTETLLAYRDSFGNLLYPYLADSFAAATFSRAVTYDLMQPADCVLIELVERNLRYLVKNLPVMPAPKRECTVPDVVSGTVSASSGKAPEGYSLIKGTLPQTPDTDSCVYLVCGQAVYEAFLTKNGGYGGYVPADVPVDRLLFTQNGQHVLYEIQPLK